VSHRINKLSSDNFTTWHVHTKTYSIVKVVKVSLPPYEEDWNQVFSSANPSIPFTQRKFFSPTKNCQNYWVGEEDVMSSSSCDHSNLWAIDTKLGIWQYQDIQMSFRYIIYQIIMYNNDGKRLFLNFKLIIFMDFNVLS